MIRLPARRKRQAGSVLVVALVLLAVLTLITLTSFRLDKGNLQIVGNSQQRTQSFAAAQAAIEQTISRPQFAATPADAIPNPCNGQPNTVCTDVNGDGVNDVTVVVTPSCVSTQVIGTAQLKLTDAEDKGCTVGVSQDFGTVGTASNNSLCSSTVYDIKAVATDNQTKAAFVANEGVALRTSTASTTCP